MIINKMFSNRARTFFAMFVLLASFAISQQSYATVTPTLSLSTMSDGDSVSLQVNGDPNLSVILYYFKQSSGNQFQVLGSTGSSGSFSTTVSSSVYGIITGTPVHVSVGGINGAVSSVVLWPTVTNVTANKLTLNQTGVVVPIGQSVSITATNNTGGTLYISNNSNPAAATINLSGNQISVVGNTYGSTVFNVCAIGNTSNCPSVYVTVENSGAQALSFSQNNITIASGQNVPITITGGTGIYSILNNSNSNNVSASINGTTITLSTSVTSGSSSITVCSTDMNSCGIVNVTVGTTSTAAVSFSQSYPSVAIGQTTTVSVYGGTGTSYYVSTNTNPSVAQAVVSGSVLSLTGVATGTTTVTVCSSTGGCNTLPVTVSFVSSGGAITLSQSSLTVLTNQTLSLTISGGSTPYNLPVNSSSIFQASINGNILTVTGVSNGSAQVAVCSASGGCTWLSLQVNTSTTTSGNQPILSPSSVSLTAGQSSVVSITGTGGYYVSGNSNSSVAAVTISGSVISISGIISGSTNVSICQSGGQCSTLSVSVGSVGTTTLPGSFLTFSQGNPILTVGQSTTVSVYGGSGSNYYSAYNSNSAAATITISGNILTVSGAGNGDAIEVVCSSANNCGSLFVSVGTGAPLLTTPSSGLPVGCTVTTSFSVVTGAPCGNNITPVISTPTVVEPTILPASSFIFTSLLSLKSNGNEVRELQKKLKSLGYYSGPINGSFGPLTEAGVKKLQKAHGLKQAGYVGPSTRSILNKN